MDDDATCRVIEARFEVDEHYEIEKLLGERIVRQQAKDRVEHLVEWKGYTRAYLVGLKKMPLGKRGCSQADGDGQTKRFRRQSNMESEYEKRPKELCENHSTSINVYTQYNH
ncbi:hypothetical protein N0V88_006939 [Collariella sp. IMI 366227]|nr:hypothetical protein N0V88_006939 [Collariella sp. IMI 366227]